MQKSSFRVAAGKVMRAMAYAYSGRKIKKRDYRALWNARINAAARKCGTTYSKLLHNLAQKGVELDRKILADIAANDFEGFTKLVEMASG
jgi:large subunit ribosomal protein L20